MKNFLLNLLFPKSCLGCRESDTWFCNRCFSLIRPNQTQWCYLCRKPHGDGRTCPSHSQANNVLDGLVIAAHYDGNPMLKNAIKELKYHRRADVGEKLGQLLRFERSANCEIIPVPLHPNRLKKRGFNHSLLLAKALSLHVSELLIRTRDTPSQVECRDRQTRLKNPQGSFALVGNVDPEKTYVLVDDLITTGATLEECCKVLKENGAKTVWGLVLARN